MSERIESRLSASPGFNSIIAEGNARQIWKDNPNLVRRGVSGGNI